MTILGTGSWQKEWATRPATYQNQQDASTAGAFRNVLSELKVVPRPDMDSSHAAEAGTTRVFYAGRNYGGPLTFIHETFHVGPYSQFTDSVLADTLGAPYQRGKTPQKTEDNASKAWDQKLQEACGSSK